MFLETFLRTDKPVSEKAYRLGKVSKGIKCTITGCAEDAVRSISSEDVSKAGLKAAPGRGYLCKNHYRELKKKLRKDRQIDKWRMMP